MRPSDVSDAVALAGRGREFVARLKPDHETLRRRRVSGDGWYSAGFYVAAAVAPSRRVRPVSATRLGTLAIHFTEAGWPQLFGDTPTTSFSELVRFETRGPDGELNAVIEVHGSGLVEMLWRMPVSDGEMRRLCLIDVLVPIAQFARAVRGHLFSQLAPRRRHVDWYISLSPYQSTAAGPLPWSELILPALSSARRASDARPFSTPTGLAALALRGWRRGTPVVRLLEVAATDLLLQNGYFEFGRAPADAARLALDALSAQSGVRTGNGRHER